MRLGSMSDIGTPPRKKRENEWWENQEWEGREQMMEEGVTDGMRSGAHDDEISWGM